MKAVDVDTLPVVERLPGWRGRYFHSANMTFAHFEFTQGASIHEHFHPQEEVWEVIEGEVEVKTNGNIHIARLGQVVIVPGGTPHSATALSDGLAIIVDYPLRHDLGKS